jgi:hypothetical protein
MEQRGGDLEIGHLKSKFGKCQREEDYRSVILSRAKDPRQRTGMRPGLGSFARLRMTEKKIMRGSNFEI